MRIVYDAGSLTIGIEGLEEVYERLGNLQRKAPTAVKNALNTTARKSRKLMISKAKARYAVNAAGRKHLDDLAMKSKATVANLEASLFISKFRSDLGYFEHSPTQHFTGVSVLTSAPKLVTARVLKENPMKPLTGTGGLSKGFLVEFNNGEGNSNHIGMVQRVLGSDSEHTETKSGAPRWRNAAGNVEKLQTMGAPSAAAMHRVVFRIVEPDIEDMLALNLENQIDKILAREAAKRGNT